MDANQIATLATGKSATSYGIGRYQHLGAALDAAFAGTKIQMVVMGDSDTFWVMRPAWATKLERAGYEIAR